MAVGRENRFRTDSHGPYTNKLLFFVIICIQALCDQQGVKLEEWRVIPEFPAYEVSNLGRVRSGEIFLKQNLKGDDVRYYSVELWTGTPCLTCGLKPHGKAVRRRVHALVLAAFVGPRPNNLQCAHLDGDSLNNTLSNLKYVTAQENNSHKIAHGTSKLCGIGARFTHEEVTNIREMLLTKPLRQVARETGFAVKRLQRLKNGRSYG